MYLIVFQSGFIFGDKEVMFCLLFCSSVFFQLQLFKKVNFEFLQYQLCISSPEMQM